MNGINIKLFNYRNFLFENINLYKNRTDRNI